MLLYVRRQIDIPEAICTMSGSKLYVPNAAPTAGAYPIANSESHRMHTVDYQIRLQLHKMHAILM